MGVCVATPSTRNVVLDVIDSYRRTERSANNQVELFRTEHAGMTDDVERLKAEKQAALKREAEAAKSKTIWNTASSVAQYVADTGVILLGWTCGGYPAALLMTSGVIGLGVRLLRDTHCLPPAPKIEMGAFLLQAGLNLAGGLGAWRTGVLAAAQIGNLRNGISLTVTAAGQVMAVGARLGDSYYGKKSADLRARMKELDAEITSHQQNMTQATVEVTKMLEASEAGARELQQAIQAGERR